MEPGVFLPVTKSRQPVLKVCLWGFLLNRSSGKGKKQPSLHYTAAQLLEKGVLVEIEDLPVSQYVSLGDRMSDSSCLQGGTRLG